LSSITLKEFAFQKLDGFYNPNLSDAEQCTGWYVLEKMGKEKVETKDFHRYKGAFHPNLYVFLRIY
jgi:hypothetical protein